MICTHTKRVKDCPACDARAEAILSRLRTCARKQAFASPAGYSPELDKDALIYPCVDCGKMRSQNQGGTTFTVCDECWDKRLGGE